jgi:hypothetical protein
VLDRRSQRDRRHHDTVPLDPNVVLGAKLQADMPLAQCQPVVRAVKSRMGPAPVVGRLQCSPPPRSFSVMLDARPTAGKDIAPISHSGNLPAMKGPEPPTKPAAGGVSYA